MEQEHTNNAKELTREELLELVKKYEQMLFDKAKELEDARESVRKASIFDYRLSEVAKRDMYKAVNNDFICDLCKYCDRYAQEPPCSTCTDWTSGKAQNFVWRGVIPAEDNKR